MVVSGTVVVVVVSGTVVVVVVSGTVVVVSGAAVVPGDPGNSLLIQRLEGTIAPRMPQNLPPLSPAEIDVIKQWIQEGAQDN